MDLNWIVYPIAFLVTLGLVVTVHEFGHYIVARYFGVKVIRFSIGFGKPFYSWHDKHGTEFCVCSIPLGGYVRLLDSRQDEIKDPDLQQQDFSAQPVFSRICVYFAGPGINLLFAVLVFSLYALLGVTQLPPVVGLVDQGSIAAQAGIQADDELLEIAGKQVSSWEDVSFQFIEEAGFTGKLPIRLKRVEDENLRVLDVALPVTQLMANTQQSPLQYLGITPKFHLRPAVIGQVHPDMPASAAGWKEGDLILSLDNQPLEYWNDLYEYVRQHPSSEIAFVLERENALIEGFITPNAVEIPAAADGSDALPIVKAGQIGVGPQALSEDSELVRVIEFNPVTALAFGVEQTWDRTRLVVISIGKLFTGALALDNVTGPVTIAEIAGKTAQNGVSSFLNFLAYLSISLGVFNLLPVPLLDGGHIAYAFVELIRGKPLSLQAQQKGMMVGIALLGSLMVLALFNDVARLLS